MMGIVSVPLEMMKDYVTSGIYESIYVIMVIVPGHKILLLIAYVK